MIDIQVLPDAQRRPHRRMGKNVAEGDAGPRSHVDFQKAGRVVQRLAPARRVVQDDAGFVLQLVVPAARLRRPDHVVPHRLGLAGQRERPDDADIQHDVVQQIAFGILGDGADARVKPSGVGPVVRIGGPGGDVFRRIHVLPDREYEGEPVVGIDAGNQ